MIGISENGQDIGVHVEAGVLTVRGERRGEQEVKGMKIEVKAE